MSGPDAMARAACEELMVRSYRMVDDGRAGSAVELFTEDGRFTVTGAFEIEGREALTGFFGAREADRDRRTRHCLSNLEFDRSSPSEARIRATLLLFVLGGPDATTPSALADVEDHYRLEGGAWRIASRTTTLVAGGA